MFPSDGFITSEKCKETINSAGTGMDWYFYIFISSFYYPWGAWGTKIYIACHVENAANTLKRKHLNTRLRGG